MQKLLYELHVLKARKRFLGQFLQTIACLGSIFASKINKAKVILWTKVVSKFIFVSSGAFLISSSLSSS